MKWTSFICLIALFYSCKNENNTPPPTQATPSTTEIPSDFLAFYDRFHSDSIFQMNHTVFPVMSGNPEVKYNKESWQIHKPFDAQGGNFLRSFGNINGIIIELIQEKTGFVTIERRFSKITNDYHLIYYDIRSDFGADAE